MTYVTNHGYEVIQTLGGLEVYDGDTFVCALDGKTFDDYIFVEIECIDDDALEADIKDQVEVDEFLDNMGGIY